MNQWPNPHSIPECATYLTSKGFKLDIAIDIAMEKEFFDDVQTEWERKIAQRNVDLAPIESQTTLQEFAIRLCMEYLMFQGEPTPNPCCRDSALRVANHQPKRARTRATKLFRFDGVHMEFTVDTEAFWWDVKIALNLPFCPAELFGDCDGEKN